MLSRMEMDVDDALSHYTLVGNEVFARPRPFSFINAANLFRPKYNSGRMKAAINTIIGKGLPQEVGKPGASPKDIALANSPARCRT